MSRPGDEEARWSRYLLGRVSEEERDALEAEYFADDESFERLQAAKDALFDDYAAGRMPPADQAAFRERHLASPEGRERVTFAQALHRRSSEAAALPEDGPARRRLASLPAWVAWAACLAAGVGAAWLAVQNVRLRTEVERLQAERRADPPPVPPSPVDPGPAPIAPQGPAVQAVRIPVETRAPIEVALAHATRSIRLEVALRGNEVSASFDAVLRRPDGREIWRQAGLVPQRFGDPLVVTAPADALPDGEYVLAIEGEAVRDAPQPASLRYRLRLVRAR
jgi:hypothetical protein